MQYLAQYGFWHSYGNRTLYSLRPKMIVLISNLGNFKAHLPLSK